jgi:hypothetical protein
LRPFPPPPVVPRHRSCSICRARRESRSVPWQPGSELCLTVSTNLMVIRDGSLTLFGCHNCWLSFRTAQKRRVLHPRFKLLVPGESTDIVDDSHDELPLFLVDADDKRIVHDVEI